ncbi:MAG: PD-(D/E)XK nuclease family protein [Actinomycetes bacterium]
MTNARAFISPSDLTFSWDGCHRCLWLYYNHQVKAPLFMPLVSELADMQERYFIGASSEHLHAAIPEGKVLNHGGFVQSTPIEVNAVATPFAIRGKYDLVMEFPDGTYGVIDCKFQARDNDKSGFYSPQLEAYAFALEHPAKGEPKKISSLGLLVWSPVRPRGNAAVGFGLELSCSWYPIPRDPAALQHRLAEFIAVITGPTPEAKATCDQCRYISTRREILGNE